ncbi:hypothetical protein V6N13_002819 [Hibiscus sabdariffa]|uniref:WRKY domain-containing protein n=2 Tax=Hibiscus sabdariffa TaxID=183260 RepID=A0ABR2NYP4_9ROSI
MEEVEEANKAAVESCHRVLRNLSQPQDQVHHRNLMAETGEAVSRFKRVVSLLNTGLGHARVRKQRKLQTPFPQSIFLDNQHHNPTDYPSKDLQLGFRENSVQELSSHAKSSLCMGDPSLELSSNGKSPLQLAQQPPSGHHHFLNQKQQLLQQRLQLQLQMKLQAEMLFRKSNSGINLNSDSSSCTPTTSSTRSLISSLSIDGSVANLDNGNAFRLSGAPRFSDQGSQHKKCSGKCGSSGKCHCSKKRKHRVKRSIKVPALSNKLSDIPPDDYSWRKYGQKPIKGSPHPRGYYKCSSMRGCLARKQVENCLEDPSKLMVTYEGEHNHPKLPSQMMT